MAHLLNYIRNPRPEQQPAPFNIFGVGGAPPPPQTPTFNPFEAFITDLGQLSVADSIHALREVEVAPVEEGTVGANTPMQSVRTSIDHQGPRTQILENAFHMAQNQSATI
ncbi:hypothetical protein WOLCODRAFT_157232 [Wolfiporia cocos MD-104 SS10]|uniref:Uncharacterized protein n=1 Tax=Wolfiporia cocos (strain MD-104) TaxID=742152 RepID=A0A2H3J2P2_WOLCO|nr:hypothetical protein WOLCODRAFT_157232 [Wolfiporia cocos MD-104 SS10]